MKLKGMVFFLLFLASQCFADTTQLIPEKPDGALNKSIMQKDEKNMVIELPGGVKLEMVYIQPGEFMMGSPQGEVEPNECPQHKVRITKGFYLGKYEVTQAQWKAVTGTNPCEIQNYNRPVENVSWNECQDFARKLSERFNKKFRLPTEAEWEYAGRAGTTTPHFWEGNLDDEYVWSSKNSDQRSHDVGQLKPNAWGLYDINGNVWEWCQDWYEADFYNNSLANDPSGPATGSDRVARGGSWNGCDEYLCRSAFRAYDYPDSRFNDLGFRIAVTVTDP